MPSVHVEYEQLQNVASQLKTGRQEVETQLNRLMSLINGLVGTGFATERASGKFLQSYEQWNSGAKNVMEGLDGMSSFLNTAIAQHQQLDQQLSQSTGG